jgi:hypothetical protein
MCSTQRCVAAVVERPVEAANWQVEERHEGHRVPMRSEGCRQLVRVVLKHTRHGRTAFPSSVLGPGITVPDPNPPHVYDAHGGCGALPWRGVVGRSGACAARTARPAARATTGHLWHHHSLFPSPAKRWSRRQGPGFGTYRSAQPRQPVEPRREHCGPVSPAS